MGKKTKDLSNTFRTAVRDVKRLSHTKVSPSKPPPKIKIKRPTHLDLNPEQDSFVFSDFEYLPDINANETIQFARSGVQHKILRNLRRGNYNIEAVLDLHGKTISQARELLNSFLLGCRSRQLRTVLIIHGKGRENKPILKNKLNNWLRQIDEIVAFCSAAAKDGGQGALYLLLRRRVSLGK